MLITLILRKFASHNRKNTGIIYKKRIADSLLERKLAGKGAVLIEGPQWCGKTATASMQAKSTLDLGCFERLDYLCTFITDYMLSARKERIYEDTEVGRVTFRKSVRSSRVSIRIHPVRGVTVTVPYFTSYDTGMKFYLAKRDWVLATVAKQRSRAEADPAPTQEQIEEMRKVAKKVLPKKLAVLAARYGFTYNRVAVKNNRTNWGSCSAKNNINLNINLVRLPEALCDYVILHELCHLKHRDHGPQFHALLEKLCSDNLSQLMGKNAEAIRSVMEKDWTGSPSDISREDEARSLMGLASKIRRSRSSQPVRYTMEQQLRSYRLQ